jgi:hypothetical protein
MQNAADHPAIIDAIFPAHVRGQKRLDPLPLLVVQPEQVASHDLCSDFESRQSLSDSPFKPFIEFGF